MPKTVRKDSNSSDETQKKLLVDGESTIESSGLFGKVSAFIPTLTFLSGQALGKEIPLIHRQLILGRGDDCDIMIPDPAVSRKHLQIDCRKILRKGENPALKVVLRDLGSRNGTQVNYTAVRRAVLKPGDLIALGCIILKYDHRDLAEQTFYDEIYRLATTDSLTNILNKASIMRFLSEEIAGNARKRSKIAVILADIDGFKSLNDLFGHLTGDRVLQIVADLFKSSLRNRDRVGRFGGDEFLIVLPETGPKGAARLAERMREVLKTSIKKKLDLTVNVTLSMGVASGYAHKTQVENLIEHADIALYRAKSLGRNRAEVWKTPRISTGVR